MLPSLKEQFSVLGGPHGSLGGPLGAVWWRPSCGKFCKIVSGVLGEVPGASWGGPGTAWGPPWVALEGFRGRLREEGRASEGRMSFEQIQKLSFSCSLEATLVNQRLGSMANLLNLLATLQYNKAKYICIYIHICISARIMSATQAAIAASQRH